MSDYASEKGHYYWPDGRSCYEVERADGKGMRDTTLRDARKLGLFPGVTTIIRCAAAPGLEVWKRRQLALACLTLPKIDGESEDDFLARAEEDSKKEGDASAAKGTVIHAAVETHYRGQVPDMEWWPWVLAVTNEIADKCGRQEWLPEKGVAHPSGYGTKIDLHSKEWVLDFKTKDGLDDRIWDEHKMQVAAGIKAAAPGACGGIVFINRNEPQAKLVQIPESDIEQGWEMFCALRAYWQAKNNYRP